jgi:hypothetical protein
MKEAGPYIAIVALLISLGNLSLYLLSYNKNKIDTFNQRRDHLAQVISELNAKVNEVHMIIARYEIVAVKRAGLPLSGEQAEGNMALIASIKRTTNGLGQDLKSLNESIGKFHLIYSDLTSETDAAQVERWIALAQVTSDDFKKYNDDFLSGLHILETTNLMLETNLAETDKKIRQINLDADEKIKQLILDFERRLKDLGL